MDAGESSEDGKDKVSARLWANMRNSGLIFDDTLKGQS
jgi:hypothetical protein